MKINDLHLGTNSLSHSVQAKAETGIPNRPCWTEKAWPAIQLIGGDCRSSAPIWATRRRSMAKRQRARTLKARFPRLRQIRQEQLGWEIVDILSRLPGSKPSISSIYRLEQGDAIRMSSARRVFDVVNGALHNSLDASKELEASW